MFKEQAGKGFVLTKKDQYNFNAAVLHHDDTFLYIHHVVSEWRQVARLELVEYIDFTPLD